MSYTPPVPSANQSPYPLQEAPHLHTIAAADSVEVAAGQDKTSVNRVATIGFIVAAVFAAASLATATMWVTERQRSNKRTKA